MIIPLVLIITTSLIVGYVIIWWYSNDNSVPLKSLPPVSNVLAIFPHPDDESLSCGGTLHDFETRGVRTHIAVLTLGERGVEGASFTPTLKQVRKQEMKHSAQALKTSHLHLSDLGDGELTRKAAEVGQLIRRILDRIRPELILTYDLSGLYGHPDHIIVSQLVTTYCQQHPRAKLWYISRPRKLYDRMTLPVHMAEDQEFLQRRTRATHRIRVSLFGVIAKVKSLYAHQSQHFAFKKSRPWLPLWYWVAAQTDEYFYEVQ